MKNVVRNRIFLALIFITIALVLGIIFLSAVAFPENFEGYFEASYYNQFGPLAITIELLAAGLYLFWAHRKTNFTMALFAFTALLDPFFNLTGLFTSQVPLYATVLLVGCALMALWMAFSNIFDLGRISFLAALASFGLGVAIELFFNYW
ncbi:MAG: hypothetical protein AAGB24_08805 [Bacteroidota bacterium]